MKLAQSLITSTLGVLLVSGMAFGQQTGTGPTSGGPTGGSTPVGKPAGERDLPPANPADLESAVPVPTIPEDTPITDEPEDDPRDTPPPTLYGEELDTETDTIFYVIDVSCSMGWDDGPYTDLEGNRRYGDRMTRAKCELSRSILGLAENFEFNIIGFDCNTRQWQRGMQPADDGHKSAAVGWVGSLRPDGATGTGPATAQALRSEPENLTVVLLTDGAPNCGANGSGGHRNMIRNANNQGATINVFGIAASGSYRAFCQGVASDSGGSYFDVP